MQLLTAYPGERRIKLGEDPLRLRFAAVLQARAGVGVNQAVAVLPEKRSPRLLAGGIHWPFNVAERSGFLQQRQPLLSHPGISLFTGADQPHQLAVQTLHKAVIQRWGNIAHRLFG